MNKRTVYVGFKFSHMGAHTGYDLIKFHAGYDMVIDCQKNFNSLQKFLCKRSKVAKCYERIFGSRLWWVEWRCLFFALTHSNLVFHFVYAENLHRYLGWFKWLGFKIVCTYHQPASFFEKHPEYLLGVDRVDDIIVLSEEIGQIFKKWKANNTIHVIPHGVDIDFFCPDPSIQSHRQVLMVGNWLRNFKFAAQVFERLLHEDAQVEIYVVASMDNLNYFQANTRMHLLCGISDEDLLLRYQSAAVVFLPLDGFVANNALLEAAAVGSPLLIASGQTGGISQGNFIEYIPLDVDTAVRRIVERLVAPHDHASHQRAWVIQQFSWTRIGEQTQNILAGKARKYDQDK